MIKMMMFSGMKRLKRVLRYEGEGKRKAAVHREKTSCGKKVENVPLMREKCFFGYLLTSGKSFFCLFFILVL